MNNSDNNINNIDNNIDNISINHISNQNICDLLYNEKIQEIRNLNQQMNDLNNMSISLHENIVESQDKLDQISQNLEQTNINTIVATEDLQKIQKTQSKLNRTKFCIAGLTGATIGGIIGGPIGFIVGGIKVGIISLSASAVGGGTIGCCTSRALL